MYHSTDQQNQLASNVKILKHKFEITKLSSFKSQSQLPITVNKGSTLKHHTVQSQQIFCMQYAKGNSKFYHGMIYLIFSALKQKDWTSIKTYCTMIQISNKAAFLIQHSFTRSNFFFIHTEGKLNLAKSSRLIIFSPIQFRLWPLNLNTNFITQFVSHPVSFFSTTLAIRYPSSYQYNEKDMFSMHDLTLLCFFHKIAQNFGRSS